jgi:hypothetical protein
MIMLGGFGRIDRSPLIAERRRASSIDAADEAGPTLKTPTLD